MLLLILKGGAILITTRSIVSRWWTLRLEKCRPPGRSGEVQSKMGCWRLITLVAGDTGHCYATVA
jgi:hypothetical protein